WIQENGASFFDDLLEGTRLLRSQLEEALGELVAAGLVTSDSFGGLRALLVPARDRSGNGTRRRRHADRFDDAGRWSLVRRTTTDAKHDGVEHAARTLLHRYGVVFWRLIEGEAAWLP